MVFIALPQAAAAQVTLEPFIGGRVVTSTVAGHAAYTYSWPGVYFEARFIGDAVDVKIDDAQNNLYLYVDGVHKLTLTRPGRTTVSLRDLDGSVHVVRLEKASETQDSTGTFDGFYIGTGEQALPPPRYDRRIEFIGDSYTVGYGDTARGQTCTVDDVRETTDTSESFAPLTAKHFNAAYRIVASSGHGVVRNYGGRDPGDTMPVLYPYSLFDRSVPADDSFWTPDVVVIGLGTNDFSTPLGDGEAWHTRAELHADFVRRYVEFVGQLRAKWPTAQFILMASTSFDHEIVDAVNAVADTLKHGGMTNLDVLAFDGLDYQACDGHPSLNDEHLLSQLLIERLARLPKFGAVSLSVR
jgi:lysophospholipase L1-like esterase